MDDVCRIARNLANYLGTAKYQGHAYYDDTKPNPKGSRWLTAFVEFPSTETIVCTITEDLHHGGITVDNRAKVDFTLVADQVIPQMRRDAEPKIERWIMQEMVAERLKKIEEG